MAPTRGVVYVAVGDTRFRGYALLSMATLRHQGYEGRISVISDLPISGYGCVRITVPPGGRMLSRQIKTRLDQYTPFDHTLYLDCDMLVLRWPQATIWEQLEDAEIALCRDVHPTLDVAVCMVPVEKRATAGELELTSAWLLDRPYFNSGVIAWRRSPATGHLFSLWHQEWLRLRSIDQLALARAQQRTAIAMRTLGPMFNAPSGLFRDLFKATRTGVCILHFFTADEQRRLHNVAHEVLFDLHTLQQPVAEHASAVRKRGSMWKGMIVVMLLTAGLLASLWLSTRASVRQPWTWSGSGLTLERVQTLAELVTVRVEIADVQETKLTGYTGSIKAALLVRGELLVGVDLSQAEFEQRDELRRTAVLRLPSPHLVSAKLDMSRTKVFGISARGLWQIVPGGSHFFGRVD